MNVAERKYRFSEIMSTVSLLPDISMDDSDANEGAEIAQEWVLPNLTMGLSDKRLQNSIICQALRENTEFQFKIVALLTNSATNSIQQKIDNDDKPSDEDVEAIGVGANILWSIGETTGLFQTLGLLGSLRANFDVSLPTNAYNFLRSNGGVEAYGQLDPLSILEGED
jgi:hypothetical protein